MEGSGRMEPQWPISPVALTLGSLRQSLAHSFLHSQHLVLGLPHSRCSGKHRLLKEGKAL